MEERESEDIWRVLHPTLKRFTWHSNTKPRIHCRLDYFLVNNNINTRTQKVKIIAGYNSDHSAVHLHIKLSDNPRGRGLWKFNKNLLNNPSYCIKVKESINETIEDNPNTHDALMWETIKCKIRGMTIKFAATEKRKKIDKISTLTAELTKIQEERDNTPEVCIKMEEILQREENIKKQLDKYIIQEVDGGKLRSRTLYYEDGEKCSKYFIGLEKARVEKKTIKILETDDGTILNSNIEIMKQQHRFYKHLYTSKTNDYDFREEKTKEFLTKLDHPELGR